MTKGPSEKEMTEVLQLSAQKRYRYLVKRIADEEALWGLWSDGWILMRDESGRELVPIWSDASYATVCAKGDWVGCEPRQIDLYDWIENWLPSLEEDGRLVAVFPLPDGNAATREPGDLLRDLEEELQKY